MTHNDHANSPIPGLFDGPGRQAMFAEFVRSGIQQWPAAVISDGGPS